MFGGTENKAMKCKDEPVESLRGIEWGQVN